MSAKLFGKIVDTAAEHDSALGSLGAQNASDGRRQRAPLAAFFRELLASFGGERVEARLAIVARHAPFDGDPALGFETLESRIEGAVLDQQHVFRLLLDGARDSLPVLRSENQRTQNQQIEGSLEESYSGRHFT